MIRQLRRRFSASPGARFALLLAVMLLGCALRIYKLDAQSFWYDEGNSARIAERSLQLIIAGAAGDIHPPLYYLALHYWRSMFGEGMVALRMLSVLCGVLLVGLTYLVGKAAFNMRTGVIAALLLSFSPFAVYYSQEARMYVLLALEAAASTWTLLSIFDFRLPIADSRAPATAFMAGKRIAAFVLYVIATSAGLYTQYAYPFVMIAQGVCVLLWLLTNGNNRARVVATYAALNIVAIALYLPWLPIAIRQVTSWTVAPQDYDLGRAVLDAYRWLVVGRTLPLDQAWLPMLYVSALVLVGLVLGLSMFTQRVTDVRRNAEIMPPGSAVMPQSALATLSLLILALLPFTLLFVFKLYREAYLKFLLVCVSPWLILAARGIDGIAARLSTVQLSSVTPWFSPGFAGRLSASVLTIGLILFLLPSLDNLYSNPAYARDDYRGIARMIEADARPGDAILFNAPNQWEVFTYYHRQGAPAIPLIYHPENDAAVDQQLKPIAAQYIRLFVLYYGERESDPDARFERWLMEHTFKADEQWIGNIRLAVYATHAPVHVQELSARFGDAIRLLAVGVDLEPKASGDLLPVRLTWQANARPDRRYKVFVHLGGTSAPPVAQNDAEPVAGFDPTDTWNAGDEIVDQRAVWIKPTTPAGHYGLYVGMYDSVTGKRLPIFTMNGQSRGDRLWLGDVSVDDSR